jgi:glycosyltransferase involved in cell wall biosynthesis
MLSLIVPAHNEEQLLGRTLEAILRSAVGAGPFEVIVVDDASTDRTGSIAAEFGARVVRVEHRQIAATRNSGARAARGELFFFIDADTVVNPAAIRAACQAVQRGAVGGGFVIRFDEHLPLGWRLAYTMCIPIMRRGWVLGGACLFCTRAAFARVGGFDERYFASEEVHFIRALERQGRVVVPRPEVVTSARKIRPGMLRELLRLGMRLLRHGTGALQTRDGLDVWYGPR